MKKVLIVADGVTTAHPTRMEQLAMQMDKSQFEIHFATPEKFFPLLSLQKKFNIPLYSITSVPTDVFSERLFKTMPPWTNEELQLQFDEDLALIRKIKPDIVIGDTRTTLASACKKENVIFYNLLNFHWNPLYNRLPLVPYTLPVKIFGRTLCNLMTAIVTPIILHFQVKQMNSWLSSVGAPNVKNIFEFYSQGDYLLFPDLKENFAGSEIPKNGHFIGPLIWKSEKISWPSHWGTLDPNKKYAFVSMGSSGVVDHIPKVVRGLNKLGYTVLYAGQKSVFKDLKEFDMLVADFVPIDEALRYCSLAIGNGGTGTTYFFMSKGVIFYNIPTNLDQYLSVHRLKEMGLSNYQDIDFFSEDKFVENIAKLVNSKEAHEINEEKKKAIEENLKKNVINQILASA